MDKKTLLSAIVPADDNQSPVATRKPPEPAKPAFLSPISCSTPANLGKGSPITVCLWLQRICLQKASNPEISEQNLLSIIRAWDTLEERKRVLRGVPLPGMHRPYLDPVQIAKEAKRDARILRQGLPINIQSTLGPIPLEEAPAETPTDRPPETQAESKI